MKKLSSTATECFQTLVEKESLVRRIDIDPQTLDVRIIDTAQISTTPVSPNVRLNTILGGLFGLVISVAFITLRELFDVRVRTGDDLVQRFSYPVLGTIPEIFVSYDSEGSSDGEDTHETGAKDNGKGA